MAKKAAKSAAKKKRAVSGKRGRPGRGKQQKSADPRGIIGIVVFCLGLLALVCQFVPSNGGFLNRCMLVVRGLGGMLCLLLPVVLCWAGVTLVFFGEKRLSLRTLIYSTLIFLFVETMFQMVNIIRVNGALAADGASLGYGAFLARSFSMSSLDCKGGGLIGALLAWPLYKALDVWGGMIVLICATAIVLMALTGVSFSGLGMRISELLDDLRVDWQERREEKSALRAAAGAETGDVLLVCSDAKWQRCCTILGQVRLEVGRKYGLIDENKFNFLWVTNFPLFEYSEEEGRWMAMHHPFTMPTPESIPLLESDPGNCYAIAYDIVLNGVELGGGSIRVNDPDLQDKMFHALGFTEERARESFGFLMDAYRYGAPPHGGMAYGLDRLVMLMLKKDSIRDVIAFPKVQNAGEVMSGCPEQVDEKQLRELSIACVAPEKE